MCAVGLLNKSKDFFELRIYEYFLTGDNAAQLTRRHPLRILDLAVVVAEIIYAAVPFEDENIPDKWERFSYGMVYTVSYTHLRAHEKVTDRV